MRCVNFWLATLRVLQRLDQNKRVLTRAQPLLQSLSSAISVEAEKNKVVCVPWFRIQNYFSFHDIQAVLSEMIQHRLGAGRLRECCSNILHTENMHSYDIQFASFFLSWPL